MYPGLLHLCIFCLGLFHYTGTVAAAFVEKYTGKLVGVIDGDTLEVLNGHHTDRIRLSSIDCPEKGQAW